MIERNLPIIRGRKLESEGEDMRSHQHRTDEELKWFADNADRFEQELVWISGISAYINISQKIMFDPRSVPKRLMNGDCDIPSWSIDAGSD